MTGSSLFIGITLALRLIPFLLFGPLSSRLAEKFSIKKLLKFTDFFRAVIALSFLWIDSADDMWIIYTGTFLLACGEALYSPTRKAWNPVIVQPKSLKEVNSWEQVLLGFVLIVGALSGGTVAFFFGSKAAFLVNIVSFVAAGFILSRIQTPESTHVLRSSESVKRSTVKILPLIITSPFLVLLLAFDVAIPLINGIENVLLSVYAVQTFKAADLGVGILYSVLGTGFIVSPFVTELSERESPSPLGVG